MSKRSGSLSGSRGDKRKGPQKHSASSSGYAGSSGSWVVNVEEQGPIREESFLYVLVKEARGLKKATLDPLCVLSVGEGQHRRTSSQHQTASPYWGESFTFEVTQKFEQVRLVVFGEGKGKPQCLGQVVIPRTPTLMDHQTHEQWFPLRPASGRGEEVICGDIHLRLMYKPQSIVTPQNTLEVHVMEAKNLASRDSNGLSDPFVELSYGERKEKTKIKKKALDPEWNETFFFQEEEGGAKSKILTIVVRDYNELFANAFMGQIEVDISKLTPETWNDCWFDLKSDTPAAPAEEEDLGSVLMAVTFTQDKMLPLEAYSGLLPLIMADDLLAVLAIGDAATDREPVARNLIRIFWVQDAAPRLLRRLVTREVEATEDPKCIFRGNSIATKAVDQFMKTVGMEYMRSLLAPVVESIVTSGVTYEVDPSRLSPGEDQTQNWARLLALTEWLVHRIFASVNDCPLAMRNLFSVLQAAVVRRFPNEENVRYSVIAGFIFLRFTNPALLSPRTYSLCTETPGPVAQRALMLLAKTQQNLANLVPFGGKEGYMSEMNPFIQTNIPAMKAFIDELSAPPTTGGAPVPSLNIDLRKELATLHGHAVRTLQAAQSTQIDAPSYVAPEAVDALTNAVSALSREEARLMENQQKKLAAEKEHLAKQARQDKIVTAVTQGGTFLKYGKRGSPHPRHVYCSLTDRKIWWREPGEKKKQKPDQNLEFTDLVEVRKGHTTEVFRSKGDATRDSLAFSIVGSKRSLDLECETTALRDEWVLAFEYLVEMAQLMSRFSSGASASVRSNSLKGATNSVGKGSYGHKASAGGASSSTDDSNSSNGGARR